MKIKKADGTIIELSSMTKQKEEAKTFTGQLKQFRNRFAESEARIQERGTIQESVSKKFQSGSGLQKVMGGLEVIAAPANAIESSISNVGLRIQEKSTKDPNVPNDQSKLLRSLLAAKDLAGEAWLGLTLQKQGQYGDIFKNAGLDPTVSDATGLFLNIGGAAKILSTAGKTFGSISKMSDKGIIKSGNKLIQATNEAREVVGTKVGEAFSSVANDVVDGVKFYDDVVKLPQTVLNRAEEVFGKMEDFADNLTIGRLREFKQFLGKLRPSTWGKGERGIAENLDVEALDIVYSGIKTLMKDTLKANRGENVANNLMALEKNFSDVVKAGNVIRKAIIDPTLRKATRGGKVAEGLIKEGDVTTRTALNIIKKSGWEANKSINNAVRLLELYNRNRLAGALLQSAIKAATFGGAAGAIGGGALRKVTGQD